jgi:hypothetical protein
MPWYAYSAALAVHWGIYFTAVSVCKDTDFTVIAMGKYIDFTAIAADKCNNNKIRFKIKLCQHGLIRILILFKKDLI